MMTNLFSTFDPSNFIMKSAWMIPMLSMLMPTFIKTSKPHTILVKMMKSLKTEFNSLTNSNMSNNFLIPVFTTIFILNLTSLIPSSFPSSSQMSIILPISTSMWTMSVLFFSIKFFNKFMSHMVPTGSPNSLIPIMVLIELISNLIRPITLSVRLIANITAGHLLMHLLSSFSCSLFPSPPLLITIMISMILNTLELGVALIQSYIMCTLIALYSAEIN